MTAQFPALNPLKWETVQPHIDELLSASLTADNLPTWLQHWSDLASHLNEAEFRAYRAHTENTTDAEAEERFNFIIEEILPKSRQADQLLRKKLLAADLSKLSPDTDQVLRGFKADSDLFREENIPLQVEEDKLVSEYQKITGSMMVEFNGETQTIQQVMKLYQDPDRSVREQAFRAVNERYLQDREKLNELYLKMLKLRREIARNAGKANYRDYVWQAKGRFDYTAEDCTTFHNAIEQEMVPLVRKWYQRRQEQLNVDAIRPWDVDVDPQSRPALTPFQSGEELEEVTQRIFNQVDPELGEFFQRMRDGYLDLESRPGKAPGGYCGGMVVSKVPYIFMNAVGTHDDVQTMLHEGGHAFHFLESSSKHSLLWLYDAPMEFCEVASMAMEMLAAPYLEEAKGGFYSAADAARARGEHILSMVAFLPYMAVVDAFQHWVYVDAPEDVTAEALDAKWGELWDRYMVGVDWSGLEDTKVTGWHRKLHIFTAPFYYVEYGLALMGAWQVWRNAIENQADAVARYRNALRLGNTRTLPELFEAAGARFAFDTDLVGSIARLADEHLERLAH